MAAANLKRNQYVGKPVVFMGYDGRMYDGTITAVLRRGIQISYWVPQVLRECQTCILTADIKTRIVVQL